MTCCMPTHHFHTYEGISGRPVASAGCRRQATAHSSRSDMQSPHASSPSGTSPHSQFAEDITEQTSTRPSLDGPAEQPFRSAASDASGMGTPRTPMNGSTTPTTSGQAGKAAALQRHQQPQVSMSHLRSDLQRDLQRDSCCQPYCAAGTTARYLCISAWTNTFQRFTDSLHIRWCTCLQVVVTFATAAHKSSTSFSEP